MKSSTIVSRMNCRKKGNTMAFEIDQPTIQRKMFFVSKLWFWEEGEDEVCPSSSLASSSE